MHLFICGIMTVDLLILAGCLFACWWMHVRRFSYLRLIIVGTGGIICYLACCYFLISSDIHITQFHLPVFCRSFAYAVLSAASMTCLEEIMSFRHFLYDAPVRRKLKQIPAWQKIRNLMT